jgi:hypothetical protein
LYLDHGEKQRAFLTLDQSHASIEAHGHQVVTGIKEAEMNIAFTSIAAGVTLSGLVGTAAHAEPFGPLTVHAQEVRNTDTKGRTTDEVATFNAPADRIFDEKRFSITQEGHGKAQSCTLIPIRTPVTLYAEDRSPVELTAVTSFSLRAHAETGSGAGRLGETAFMRCNASGWYVEYKR